MSLQPAHVYQEWTDRNRRAANAAHGWTEDEDARLMRLNRDAHRAFNRGRRTERAVEGERAYQAARYRLRRRGVRR